MRQPLVVGNWKMHGLIHTNVALLTALKQSAPRAVQMAVCPSFVHLAQVSQYLVGSGIRWGAQNVSHEAIGAFTGEVAVSMLAELGCTYVIVGHSERRSLYGESDALVAEKFARVQAGGLIPILCVGESLEQREAGKTEQVVRRQIDSVIQHVGIGAFANAVVAYEPVWAIGTGKNATPTQAQAVHAFIRHYIATQYAEIAESLQILYGGSVKPSNAKDLLAMPDIDGGLIGGASLKADEFLAICQLAE